MAAEEPRRSGRATKGQNKTLDDPAEVPATAKSKKAAAKAKETKKAAQPAEEPEEEEEEEVEETIRCICGDNTDDEAGRKFIACDACEVWQHNVCMGVSLEDDEQPEHYFCEQCRPEEHKELLDAVARGEKIWEERQKSSKTKKKGGKKGRKPTKSARASEVKSEGPEPSSDNVSSQETGTKRKFEEEPEVNVTSTAMGAGVETDVLPKTPNEPTNGSQEPKKPTSSGRADKRRKSSAKETGSEDPSTDLVDIPQLPKDRQNVAIALSKLVKDEVEARVKAKSFRIPDGETADSLSKRFAQLIEYELYMSHGGPGKSLTEYGAQFRAINANFKRNSVLRERILNKTITPAELATMSSEDMASEELLKERQKMKEEVEKQSVMIRDDDKPRVRRTHKGDEIVEDGKSGNTDSVFTSKPVRRRESEVEGDGSGGAAGSPSMAIASPITTSHPPVDLHRRQSSQTFDINNVWAKTAASPDAERSPTKIPQHHDSPTTQAPPTNKATGDADIDRLLADDDNDDTYSPADVKTSDSDVIWRGALNQPGIASLGVSARFVAGNDFSRYIPWQTFLPSQIEIEGRLERTKADEYLCSLQWSKRSDVSVLALSPYDNKEAFDTIFTYFHSRGRYAVGSKKYGSSDLIKDLYISPVEKDSAPPPHIDLLDHCSIKFPVPERILLATFVVNKPASWDQTDLAHDPTSTHRLSLAGPAASPINPSAPNFSPGPRHSFTPEAGGGAASLPPNPYGQPPPAPEPSFSPQVQGILGPYANCTVARMILAATAGNVANHEAENMLAVFQRSEEARESMEVFGRALDA